MRVNETEEPLLGGTVEDHEPKNSWLSTASLIVCAMAGVGVISLTILLFLSILNF